MSNDDAYYALYGDDDSDEPIGSCESCSTNIYEDDYWVIDGERLCDQCYWYATGGGSI